MFIESTIREYIDMASSGTPTPGGGSVSALAGALGVTMACMASNFTVGKKKYRDVEPQVREILDNLKQSRENLLELTEEDSRAYDKFSKAMALPKGTDEEKKARSAAMQEAVAYAMDVPLEIVRECRDVLRVLTDLVNIANPNLVSDVGVAAILAEAALRGAKLNVEINLGYIKDEKKASSARKEIGSAREEATTNLKGISEKVAEAIGGTA